VSDHNDYLNQSLGYKLNYSARLIANRLNRKFKEHHFDITHEQWQLIVRLWEEDGQTQNTLASQTQKDEPSVSRLINNMVKRKLVRRTPHPTDRRTNLIYLTPQGKKMKDDLIALAKESTAEATSGIDPQELAICMRVLGQVIENLKT